AAPSAKVPAVTWRAAALLTLRIVTLFDAVTVVPENAPPIWASSFAPGSASPAQFTGSFQLVPVAVGPPSQRITAGTSRISSDSPLAGHCEIRRGRLRPRARRRPGSRLLSSGKKESRMSELLSGSEDASGTISGFDRDIAGIPARTPSA